MKKIIAWLLTIAAVLTFMNAFAESLPIEGKVVSTQSTPIVSQANGIVEQISFSAGDHVDANTCIATITTTKVYAPVAGTVCMWGKEGDKIDELTEQYGAIAYIEPANPYTIRTKPVDANGKPVAVRPGQKVYLICMSDGKKTGEGVITSVGTNEYTVRVEKCNFDADDKISIYTTPDHKVSNRIGRGDLIRAGISSCTGIGYIVKSHVSSGDAVEKGQLLYETIEGAFFPGTVNLNELTMPEDGVIESFKVDKGSEVDEKTLIAVIYPDSNLRIRALAPESTLTDYRVGDTVYITNQNNDSDQEPVIGKIEKISQIPEQTEYEYDIYYAVYITVDERESLYYGMNVMVSKLNPISDNEINE